MRQADGHCKMSLSHPLITGDVSDTRPSANPVGTPKYDTLPGALQYPPAILQSQASAGCPDRPHNQG